VAFSIERLGPGDEATLALLARHDGDFDLDGRGAPLPPLPPDRARAYLANPAVLHWVAREGVEVVGFLYCLLVPLRAGDGQEVLLYEIGVQKAHRRRGAGRALLETLEAFMREHAIREVWVLADNPTAVDFYRGCGYGVEDDQPVYLTRDVTAPRR